MQAKDLISDVVPAIRTNELGIKALNWMEIFRISHLPVVDNNNDLIGIISDNDIFDYDLSEKEIGSFRFPLKRPFVTFEQHIYEIIELISLNKLSIVPVLNERKRYIGIITLHDLVHQFSKLTAVENPGAVFILELSKHNYSLSQIAQIIESNDAKVLSLYLSSPANSVKLDVTIKINLTDFSAIQQTFERYDYKIKASYTRNDKVKQMLDDRFDEFLTYLNI